jgi:hypothetical protein
MPSSGMSAFGGKADIDTRAHSTTIRPWDSIAARSRTSAGRSPKKRRQHAARPMHRCLKTRSASSTRGTNARPSGCRCCSRRRSAPPSPRDTGSYGYAVRLAAPRLRSTYGASIAIPTRRSPASFRHCHAALADPTRRSLNWYAYHEALPMN